MNIFVYGSLMWKDLWQHEVRNEYASKDAFIKGYRCRKVKGKHEPAAIHSPNIEDRETVEGKLYLDVNTDDLKRIESYYGKIYVEIDGVCFVGDSEVPISTKLFVLNTEFRDYLSDDDWTKEWFERSALGDFRRKINESLF